jgi:hypothetical protein
VAETLTFLDGLSDALAGAGAYNQQDVAPPAAVLWPDKERQWEALLPSLRTRMRVFTLGSYSIRPGKARFLPLNVTPSACLRRCNYP